MNLKLYHGPFSPLPRTFVCETLHGYVYIDVSATIDFLCHSGSEFFSIKIPRWGAGRTFLIYNLCPLSNGRDFKCGVNGRSWLHRKIRYAFQANWRVEGLFVIYWLRSRISRRFVSRFHTSRFRGPSYWNPLPKSACNLIKQPPIPDNYSYIVFIFDYTSKDPPGFADYASIIAGSDKRRKDQGPALTCPCVILQKKTIIVIPGRIRLVLTGGLARGSDSGRR